MISIRLILTGIVIFFATLTHAQQVQFGVKAGANFATLSGDSGEVLDLTMRTSFHLGATAEIMFSDKFSLQPQLLYSAQGTDYENADAAITGVLKLDYINIPILAKFYITEGFSVQAGPQIGFLLSANNKLEFAGDTQEEDVKDIFKGIDFGLNFGLGYKLPSGLFFDASYNLGFSNVNDIGDDDDKNGVIQLSVGYLFNF